MSYILVIAGLALLVVGGEGIVRGSVGVAQRLGLSRAFIGTVLMGFGTSLPEFVASFGAAARGADGIAFGNVVGSNIANAMMILGAAALVYPLALPRTGVRRDALFVGLSTLGICLWVALDGLPRWGGAGLLAVFAVYMWLAWQGSGEDGDIVGEAPALARSLVFAAVGIALLVVGAELMIRGASALARGWGVSEALIGITIVGVGTSLPEAVASLVASVRRENALAFANIIGSNIFNGLAILGGTALAFPLSFGGDFSAVDAGVLVLATGLMFGLAATKNRLSRLEGALILGGYVVYLVWLVGSAGGAG